MARSSLGTLASTLARSRSYTLSASAISPSATRSTNGVTSIAFSFLPQNIGHSPQSRCVGARLLQAARGIFFVPVDFPADRHEGRHALGFAVLEEPAHQFGGIAFFRPFPPHAQGELIHGRVKCRAREVLHKFVPGAFCAIEPQPAV